MTKTTNWPATVREFGNLADQRGMKSSELFEELERDLGPFPMPPTGYTLAEESDDRWIGPERVNRGWIITPVWNSTTSSHSIEVWMADHTAPTYANLSPVDAFEFAADLIAVARASQGDAEQTA
ncbi:hypothetical protein [Arthrobacter flavus]|uniref:Uncharacterized protein n=1 Tax=Arthrobacter flavus TaxID=95172 RepID=A0ABW4Q2P0_9MICC